MKWTGVIDGIRIYHGFALWFLALLLIGWLSDLNKRPHRYTTMVALGTIIVILALAGIVVTLFGAFNQLCGLGG